MDNDLPVLAPQTPNPAYPPVSVQDAVRSLLGGVGNYASHLVHLPQQMFEASENMRAGGDYNPAPAVEMASLLAGGGMPAAERSALGALGGRPPWIDPLSGEWRRKVTYPDIYQKRLREGYKTWQSRELAKLRIGQETPPATTFYNADRLKKQR